MANKGLFASTLGRLQPAADVVNREYAPAYAYGSEHKLAQLAATGTLQDNFYSAAQVQLAELLETAQAVDPAFVAKDLVDDRFVRNAIQAVGGMGIFGLPEGFERTEEIGV